MLWAVRSFSDKFEVIRLNVSDRERTFSDSCSVSLGESLRLELDEDRLFWLEIWWRFYWIFRKSSFSAVIVSLNFWYRSVLLICSFSPSYTIFHVSSCWFRQFISLSNIFNCSVYLIASALLFPYAASSSFICFCFEEIYFYNFSCFS